MNRHLDISGSYSTIFFEFLTFLELPLDTFEIVWVEGAEQLSRLIHL